MNGKQLGLLLGLLVLLGGAGLLVEHNRNQGASAIAPGAGGKLLGENFPVNDVCRITIKQGTNEVNLAKRGEQELWRVQERNDYPANFSVISDFLLKAKDLKIVENDVVTPADLPELQLAAGQGTNAGVTVDLKDKDGKTIRSVILGKTHLGKAAQRSVDGGNGGLPNGRYVMLAGDAQHVLLVADALSEIEPKAETWLNKDFFKVERQKAVAVSYPDATNSWKISRDEESGTWKFLDPAPGEQPDTNKLTGVSTPFTSPTFDDVLTVNNRPEDTGLDKPTVVTVDTFDDITYLVKVGKKTGDDYPLTIAVTANFPKERTSLPGEKPEDKDKADKAWQDRQKQLDQQFKAAKAFENWVYLVPTWNLDMTLKDRKDLMEDKKDEAKPGDTSDASLKQDNALPTLTVPVK